MCKFKIGLKGFCHIKWFTIYIVMATIVGAKIIIVKEPKDVMIKEGEPAILDCIAHSSINGDASYRCSWLKDGAVMFVGEGKRKQFYDWIGDYRTGNCSITLQNTLVSRHQGKWRCQIINSETDDNEMAFTSSALVTILVAPTLPEIQDKSGNRLDEITIIEGHRQELHCISRHGNPAAYLRWSLNDQDVSMNATFYNNSEPSLASSGDSVDSGSFRMYTAGSWLSLIVNRTVDRSVLKCVSKHSAFSDVQNATLELNIIYPPKNLTGDNNLTVTMDETVELDCPLDGKPTPSYVWYQLQKTEPKNYPIGFQKLLKLNNFSENLMDAGYYCSASTLMGSQNLTAFSGVFMLTPKMSAIIDVQKTAEYLFNLHNILGIVLEEDRKIAIAEGIKRQPTENAATFSNTLPCTSRKSRTSTRKRSCEPKMSTGAIARAPTLQSFTRSNTSIDIGNGVLVPKDTLSEITHLAAGRATKFARLLLVFLFDIKELRNRSLTGKKCSWSKIHEAKEPIDPIRRDAIIVQCTRDNIALYVVIALGSFAVLSLAFEFVLLVYFKCHQKKAPGQSFFRNTIYELYYTRGRKMALVHVRGEHDDKGGKGYTLHISAPFVSVLMLLLDLLTIAAYVISVIFCYYEDSCNCTFLNPAVICTLIFGGIVILLQLVFLASFCIRKKEDSKYRSYARRKEDVPGSGNDDSPKRNKNNTTIVSPLSMEQNENSIKQSNKNERNEEMPGSVPV